MTGEAQAARPARRPRKDAERNRRRILASARTIWGERGLAASLDDVAKHAGVGVGTAYRHFPDKQHLVEAMFADVIEEILDLGREALDAADPWQGFVTFCWRSAERFAADRGLYDVMLTSAVGMENTKTARAKVHPLCEELVARAKGTGRLREDFTATDLSMLHLMIGSVAEYTQDVGRPAWQRYVQFFLDGLRADGGTAPLPTPALTRADIEEAGDHWDPARRRAERGPP